jgi:hypothetical protein
MVNVAATFYKATLAVTTGLSAPYSNLAAIYKQQVWVFTMLSVSIHTLGMTVPYSQSMFSLS